MIANGWNKKEFRYLFIVLHRVWFRVKCLKQRIKNRNSVLNREGKSAIFVLNRARVWGARPHLHISPTLVLPGYSLMKRLNICRILERFAVWTSRMPFAKFSYFQIACGLKVCWLRTTRSLITKLAVSFERWSYRSVIKSGTSCVLRGTAYEKKFQGPRRSLRCITKVHFLLSIRFSFEYFGVPVPQWSDPFIIEQVLCS